MVFSCVIELSQGTSLDAIDVAVVEFSIARKKAAVEVPFQWKLLKYEEIGKHCQDEVIG